MTPTPAQCDTLPWPESLSQDLLRFLAFRLNCRETAADLAQETFLRLHKSSLERPPENPRALAFRIAENLAIDHQRKTSFRNRYHAGAGQDGLAEAVPCPGPGPERVLMGEQRFAQLQAALDELPETCRAVFLLHGVEGLSYAQIAARLGMSKSMVGKHLAKALLHCSQRVEE